MSCSGCEVRREWIRESLSRAKRKRDLLLQRLGFGPDFKQSGTGDGNQGALFITQSTERGDDPDHGSE